MDKAGFPWKLAENAGMEHTYEKGTFPCPTAPPERSIVIPRPSCLTIQDEDDIIQAFEKVLPACL